MATNQLTGRTALITGSTKGIGRATALNLASKGAKVVVNGRHRDTVSSLVDHIVENGGKASGVAADLSTAQGVDELTKTWPEVDILVNNLGVFNYKSFWSLHDEDWQMTFHANVMSGVRLSRHYLKGMLERKLGRVVFISSFYAKETRNSENEVHLCFSDAAKCSIASALAEMTRGTEVTVNSVLPGAVRTEGFDETQTDATTTVSRMLKGRLLTPDEVARVVAFICSDESSAINGSAIEADGGWIKTPF